MFLSGDDKVVRGKQKANGVHIMKTVQAIIVAIYEEPVIPEQVILHIAGYIPGSKYRI
jgi:hypothetical protein